MADELHYFIDEAGDDTLFAKGGRVLLGQDGVSNYFMLGKLEVDDPPALRGKLESLRQRLLADPYFDGVPSFDSARGKTALGFHAKDDLPEVRFEVLQMLRSEGPALRFYAVVKDKQQLLREVQQETAKDPAFRYRTLSLYDALVRELFSKFHRVADSIHITFAQRGKSPRTEAFRNAIQLAELDFVRKFGFPPGSTQNVLCSTPRQDAGLQAVDYFLWTLQRFFEQKEERFLKMLWPQYGEVIDLDFAIGKGKRPPSFWTQNQPLTLASRFP